MKILAAIGELNKNLQRLNDDAAREHAQSIIIADNLERLVSANERFIHTLTDFLLFEKRMAELKALDEERKRKEITPTPYDNKY
jgi:hypothetical protein